MTEQSADIQININEIDEIVKQHGASAHSLIPILQAIQNKYQFLPAQALNRVCEVSDIRPADVTGVSTFYSQFRHQPVGKHIIHVCVGTACHVKGAEQVFDSFRRQLKIRADEDTDSNKVFTLQKVACLGCCTLAPVVQIDNVTYGHVAANDTSQIIQDFLSLKKNGTASPVSDKYNFVRKQGEIRIGLGSCCIASGSGKVQDELKNELKKNRIDINIKRVGCVGMCHQTPLVEVVLPDKPSAFYARVQPEDIKSIVARHFEPIGFADQIKQSFSSILDRLIASESVDRSVERSIDPKEKPVSSFLGQQKHISTEYCGIIDPIDFEEYVQRGGFEALKKCLTELTPDQIIEQIKESGLRGRGGGGFSTGLKWSLVRNAEGSLKYIICNGDEGDPGAFMDRMLLESYPFRIIEGMIIAAYAVGAAKGFFYIRAEYPLAVDRIREALKKCEHSGLLGENILGSGFSLDLKIMEGAGAFVCGEETALISSIEGKRGMPHIRPPYPAEKGLFGCPTLVNNVETFSIVSWIIKNGSEKFSNLGTEKSKGTKVFALAGKIQRGGLIEVPMGITIREIVEEIGGGIAGGKKFKAVQVGGPSGGCIPAEMDYLRVDYEALTNAGAMMGSGGLLVLDESDCMVDIARYFLSFTQDQSCGKCTFCRIGTKRMLEILERICEGKGKEGDLKQLEDLAYKIQQNSLCGLGRTAPNPVLTTLKYYLSEYKAHINGKCPAGKCPSLIKYQVTEKCIGCTICAQKCPVGAIKFTPHQKHEINSEICVRCDSCRQVCPENAIEIIS